MSLTLLRRPDVPLADAVSVYADGQLVVVDTEDNVYLGVLRRVDRNHVAVYSGLTGRPPVIAVEDIIDIISAQAHPDVEQPAFW